MTTETSDRTIIDLMRQHGSLSVTDLATETGVTATAVRQRLSRLMAEGFVQRRTERAGRGRPSHRYSLTEKGLRSGGVNYGDLAMTLWKEIRAVRDPEVRRGLLQRISARLAGKYAAQVRGGSVADRMRSIKSLMDEREVPFRVDEEDRLPVLTALACPYPELAAQDRSVCAMERMLFSEMAGTGLRLTACRLDGDGCCTFETG